MNLAGTDIITDALARGMRRQADRGIAERLERLFAANVADLHGRFGPIVRRHGEILRRGLGDARVERLIAKKRKTMWALVVPDSDELDRLLLLQLRRREAGTERELLDTVFTSTAHWRERLIQQIGVAEAPVAPVLFMCAALVTRAKHLKSPGGFVIAWKFGLLLGNVYPDGETVLRTTIATDALEPTNRTVWERLMASELPIEFRCNYGGQLSTD
jgi:hypothetical protein